MANDSFTDVPTQIPVKSEQISHISHVAIGTLYFHRNTLILPCMLFEHDVCGYVQVYNSEIGNTSYLYCRASRGILALRWSERLGFLFESVVSCKTIILKEIQECFVAELSSFISP